MSPGVMFDIFKYKPTEIATTIPSCRDLRKLNLQLEKIRKTKKRRINLETSM